MHLFKKVLSVGLSLALCAGMVAPALAADFQDLQDAIEADFSASVEPAPGDSTPGEPTPADPSGDSGDAGDNNEPSKPDNYFVIDDGEGRYGFGANDKGEDDESRGWDIWAWDSTNDEGEDVRNVELHGDVVYNSNNDKTKNRTSIEIEEGMDVNLDLNGNDIDGGSKFEETEDGNVKITKRGNQSAVIKVKEGANLTIDDTSGNTGEELGKITGGNFTKWDYDGDRWSGSNWSKFGGGVCNAGTVTMKNGVITGNVAQHGGGVAVGETGTFNLYGGEIKDNSTYAFDWNSITVGGWNGRTGDGGGVFVNGQLNIYGGKISGNTTRYDGSAIYSQGGKIYMEDGEITGNISAYGTGNGATVQLDAQSIFIMEGGKIQDNVIAENCKIEGAGKGGAVYVSGDSIFIGLKGVADNMSGNEDKSGQNDETVYGDGTIIIQDKDNGKLSVSITGGNQSEFAVIPDEGAQVIVDVKEVTGEDGETTGIVVTVAGGKAVDKNNTETVYPDGMVITLPEGTVTGARVTKTENGDGTVTIKTDNGKDGEEHKDSSTTVTLPKNENGETEDATVNSDGTTDLPGGSSISGTDENGSKTVTTYPDGAAIDRDGNVTPKDAAVTKTEDSDGKVTIDKNGDGTDDTTITDGSINDDGTGKVNEGGSASEKAEDGSKTVTTYPGGADINKDGSVTGDGITKTDDGKGNVTIDKNGDGTDDTIITDGSINDDGTGKVNEGGSASEKAEDGSKTVTTYPDGADINKDGSVTGDGITKTDDGKGNVTIDKNGDGTDDTVITGGSVNDDGTGAVKPGGTADDGETETTYPDGAAIDRDGNVTGVPAVSKDKETGDVTITDGENRTEVKPGEDETTVDSDGTVHVAPGGSVTGSDGSVTDLPYGGTVSPDGTITANPNPNPENPENPENPAPEGPAASGGADAGVTIIAEQEVPLAGIVLVQDVVEILYQREGSPDGVDAEGEYAKAVAWAVANGIIGAEDEAEEVVTVAILRDVMASYAAYLSVEFTYVLKGEDDDIVMNSGEILTGWFATLPEKQDKAA